MIDPSARVHASADLEDDVSVGPARASGTGRRSDRARIGAECIVGRDAFIDQGVVIGDRVKIQNGALIYHGVTVEDGVFIGPGRSSHERSLPAGDHRDRGLGRTTTGRSARRPALRLLDRRRGGRRRGVDVGRLPQSVPGLSSPGR